PESVARTIRGDVLAATGLHCSVGIGATRVRAKTATELGKPRGTFRLTAENWFAVMGERPPQDLWGVGPRISRRLAGLGIGTVRQLGDSPEEPLVAEFGPNTGPHIGRLGRGAGSNRVDDTPWVARARGRETTYQHDLTTPAQVEEAVHALVAQVVRDIRAEGRRCARVHLKVRFAPFFTVNRSRKLTEPTYDAGQIASTALDLLARLEDDRPIRLLGVRAEMVPPPGGYDPPRSHGRRGAP
ncbi:MAG: DNA polymerase IV, partial [Marmoricola sp.]